MRLHVYTTVLNLFMCDVQLKVFHILYACETRRSFHQVNVSNLMVAAVAQLVEAAPQAEGWVFANPSRNRPKSLK